MAIHGDETQEVNTYSELFCHRLTLVYGHVHPSGCRWPAASLEEHGRNVGCASTLSSTNPQQPRVTTSAPSSVLGGCSCWQVSNSTFLLCLFLGYQLAPYVDRFIMDLYYIAILYCK